jgi:hypothetical protein
MLQPVPIVQAVQSLRSTPRGAVQGSTVQNFNDRIYNKARFQWFLGCWSGSIAVGSRSFVEKVKTSLASKPRIVM